MTVTPHDIAQLAQTRRTDPDLALWIADQSAEQYVRGPMTPLETKRFLKTGEAPRKEQKHVLRS